MFCFIPRYAFGVEAHGLTHSQLVRTPDSRFGLFFIFIYLFFFFLSNSSFFCKLLLEIVSLYNTLFSFFII